ncbi:uncharacterized protein LOC114916502 [Cajanus cajan]|uniref:uncharacterized protein LOC114916502 n=1 Tax=Cajanus cajan TaxID=3821 RepID=UPI0010FB67F1|nr:uncharacterized protein LOC114916502 [Cajanus cajan]
MSEDKVAVIMPGSYNRTCSSMCVSVLGMAKGKRKRVSSEPTKKQTRFLPDLNYPPPPDSSDEEEQLLFVAQKDEVVWIGEGSTSGAASREGERVEENESESSYNWIKGYWNTVRKWISSRNKKNASWC